MRFDSARADQITALIFFALGAAMLLGGYTMDRLEIRQIHPASIPGLLPMILGGIMMLCAVLLFTSAKDAPDADLLDEAETGEGDSWTNLLFAGGYSVVYALGLVGNMPFMWATVIYITVFVGHFTFDAGETRQKQALKIAMAFGFALVSAYAVALLFEEAFLVRLP